jgi:hypothetical protein
MSRIFSRAGYAGNVALKKCYLKCRANSLTFRDIFTPETFRGDGKEPDADHAGAGSDRACADVENPAEHPGIRLSARAGPLDPFNGLARVLQGNPIVRWFEVGAID